MEEKSNDARQERNIRLKKDVDSINAVRWNLLSESEKSALENYRQALLDVPQQSGFPDVITWPEMPVI